MGSRRFPPRLLFTVYCLLALLLLRADFSPAAISGRYEVKEIKPHVFVWVPDDVLYLVGDPQFGRAGTAGFIVTSEGVVVVNTTNNPFNAREMLYEIRQRTNQPVKYVINTDARGDHILGNEVFVDEQAAILSTGVVQTEMKDYQQDLTKRIRGDLRLEMRMRGIHLTLPTQTFESRMNFQLGSEEFRVLDLGKGPTAGDAAVYLPGAKVLFLGELFENVNIPRRGLTDVAAWLEVLHQVESMDVTTYIPGEGPPGDRTDLQDFREFLQWVAMEWMPVTPPVNQPALNHPARMGIAHEGDEP
jgi:glyoxylase-like metal-dependent hydrolase (beta-lactamase superfamily II)